MARPPYGPTPGVKKPGACVAAFQDILSSTVTDRTTFLCPYELGFVDVSEKGASDECCPRDLVQYSWQLAAMSPACALEQATGMSWRPTGACSGDGVTVKITKEDESICYTAEEQKFRPC